MLYNSLNQGNADVFALCLNNLPVQERTRDSSKWKSAYLFIPKKFYPIQHSWNFPDKCYVRITFTDCTTQRQCSGCTGHKNVRWTQNWSKYMFLENKVGPCHHRNIQYSKIDSSV